MTSAMTLFMRAFSAASFSMRGSSPFLPGFFRAKTWSADFIRALGH
jgi:hypothetical protein